MESDTVIIHYNEIGLKGDNRPYFEKILVENIRSAVNTKNFNHVKRLPGRIIMKLNKNAKLKEVETGLKSTFGVSSFSFGFECDQTIKAISDTVFSEMKKRKFSTFAISTKRAKKEFKYNSKQINEKIGDHIRIKLKKKVNLSKPDLTAHIEIVNKQAFVYFDSIPGLNGLPIGCSGRALVMLSGGIDSPAAAFKMMSRGLHLDFVHFHSYPITNKRSIEKVIRIVKELRKYQNSCRLYLIPFADLQKLIVSETPDKFRIILYRRAMIKLANTLSKKTKSAVLVTGESVGQVASQTIENIKVIEAASFIPILRPLIGLDKNEIIAIATKIGTYDISIEPDEDCCSLFVPKHPETRAKLKPIEEIETFFDGDSLLEETLNKIEIKRF
ncbi:MAG: tRNA uracil 4-sulfurtransferase ThiI [Candidatus Aenigmatarchaeota archaeon]